ncbi:hypothetical protein AXF42_Ash014076 [Apostasia shenzhenica]|uniref:Uncharacterized protein n=1 Tax=Apostasia shenzhenica TaxID=1088818 RepID=A0A2I0A9A3_9ASPA|nr:hypothetical protein AXF42_Ash014076 [Apostasia shenzhenica]
MNAARNPRPGDTPTLLLNMVCAAEEVEIHEIRHHRGRQQAPLVKVFLEIVDEAERKAWI